MDLTVGARVGEYEILGHLGSGGAGKVYKARHSLTNRIEAIKILHLDTENAPGQTERFMREIRVQASLQHPNIAAVYSAQEIDGRLVMAMEYVAGQDVRQLIETGAITLEHAIDICVQALTALEYAHEQDLIHRDIKPENILVNEEGVVKLTDFGLVKIVERTEVSLTAAPLGSVWYISPEQVRADKVIDARADLYSLGAVLYELVTGRPPFTGDNFYELMKSHVELTPCAPIGLKYYIPAPLSTAIMKALEKEPGQRFSSASEFRTTLEQVSPGHAAQPSRRPSPRWRRGALNTAGLAAGFVLVSAGAWELLQNRETVMLTIPSPLASNQPPEFAYEFTPAPPEEEVPETAPPPARRLREPAPPVSPAPQPPEAETAISVVSAESALPPATPLATEIDSETEEPPPPKSPQPELALLRRFVAGEQARGVALGPSGNRIAAFGGDGVKVWNTATGVVEFETGDTAESITAVALPAQADKLFVGDRNGTVRVWRLANPTSVAALGHEDEVTAIELGDNGRILIVSLRDKSIHFWREDPASGRYKRAYRSLKRRNRAPSAISFNGRANRLAATSDDKHIQIWKAIGGGKPTRIESLPGGASEVELSQDGSLVAAAGQDGVGLWHVPSRRRVTQIETGAQIHSLAFSVARRCITAAGGGRTVRLWDVMSSTPVAEALTDGAVKDVSLTLDATQLAALDQEGTVYVWKVNEPASRRLDQPFTSTELTQQIDGSEEKDPKKRGVMDRITGVFR